MLVGLLLGSVHAQAGEIDDFQWRHRAHAGEVKLTANPLTRKWRTAFYANRGFAEPVIRPYASACGFSFGVHNGSKAVLEASLPDWQAIGADGASIALRLPESWEADWQQAGVPEAARIAFRWAQFQSDITLQPGDWIMGMATLQSPPAEPFRLVVRYRDSGADHEIVLEQLSCLRD